MKRVVTIGAITYLVVALPPVPFSMLDVSPQLLFVVGGIEFYLSLCGFFGKSVLSISRMCCSVL